MRKLTSRLYESTPIFMQNIITSLEGYRKTRSRYGNTYYSFLLELENQHHSNETEIKKIQDAEMCRLIKYAVEKSSFYKDFYKDINLAEIRTVEDLKKLPVLEKEILQKNIENVYTIPESSAAAVCRSNNFGMPFKFLFTKDDIQKREAFLDFFKNQHDAVNLEMKRATFSSERFIPHKQQNKAFWRDNYYMRQRLYSSYYCYGENASEFVADLETYKPDFIDGLPSAIYEIAKYINDHKIILSFKPAAIFSASEIVYAHQRSEIEKAFDCPLRNQYTSSEGVPFITECSEGNMHYNLSSGVIETNEKGDMIVTNFNTYGTPLIRYNSGDRIEMPDAGTKCRCGSVHPFIAEIHSHSTDYLLSKRKGDLSAVYLAEVWSDFSDYIQKIQFVQNSADAIDIFIEGAENYTNTMTEAIHKMMEYTFGEDMKFNIRIVEQIPNPANHKFQPVLNNIVRKTSS